MKKHFAMVVAALAGAFAAASASAAACTTDSYTITAAAPAGLTPVSLGKTIAATSCFGINQMVPTKNPASVSNGSNLGYLNEGLLNGQDGLVPWDTFITDEQRQDLNPATDGAIDPGWIQLGSMGSYAGKGVVNNMTASKIGAFELDSIVKFSSVMDNTTSGGGLTGGKSGTWTLTLDPEIISKLTAAHLFERSHFDHLAFVVKASNSWAVYDFDFTQFADFDLTKPYSLSGTWNLNDFRNSPGKKGQSTADHGLSYLGIWARDPVSKTNNVAEPGMLALLGAGLMGMSAMRRRRQAK